MIVPGRYHIAVALAEREANPNAPGWPQDKLQTYLTYAPWRSIERAIEYKFEVDRGEIPGLTIQDLSDYESACRPVLEFLMPEDLNNLIREIFGDESTSSEASGAPETPAQP